MAAFRQAVELWDADMLELDVRVTRDGEVVVLHDATVDRTTDGTGAVADLEWARVRELDAGYRFVGLEGDFPFRGRGVGIPRFVELLEELPLVRLNVEIKARAAARRLVDIILDFGAQDRVLVAAARERDRRDVRAYPGAWGASAGQLRLFHVLHRTPFGSLYTPGADVLQAPDTWRGRRVLTPRFIREAHRRNLPVHVWTVDREDDMRRLLDWGVDAIQSDRPDRLARVLVAERGRPAPPGLAGEGA
jgi:glycerophosphoryl diester phosphodiesterase